MSDTYHLVEGWKPFNRFHRPLETEPFPTVRCTLIEGPASAFSYEHLRDRTLVKVVDSSAVTLTRFESDQDLANRRG